MMEHAICPVCESETLWATKDIDNFTPMNMNLFDQDKGDSERPIALAEFMVAPDSLMRWKSDPGSPLIQVEVLHGFSKPLRITVSP